MAFQTEHQQKQKPPKKKNNKNYPEKSTKKFILFLLCIRKPTHQKTCPTEQTYKLQRERNKTQREYIDANKLANVELIEFEIELGDEEIFLGFDNDGKAVVLKDCQIVVEDLFQKEEEAIKKVNKNLIGNQYGDEEGFEQELCNKEIENIKQIILNELGAVQETNMKDREPLNKTNINKKAKAQKKLGNLAM